MATLAQMFGAGETDTFFGLPRAEGDLQGATIAILSAAMATPYPAVGPYCAGAPAAIRAATAAYGKNLAHVNFDLGGPVLPEGVRAVDMGAVPVREGAPAENRAAIRAAVGRALAAGAVPVLVGGDDSVQIPMLEAWGERSAVTGRKIAILQIDAHIDWRDEVGGERLGLSSTQRRASEMAHVGAQVLVGQRGIGSARAADRDHALASGAVLIPARAVARGGIAAAAAAVPEGADVVVCLDLDALDPSVMPAVIGRTAGGLSYWDVVDLVAAVAGRARIAGFGMVEFMPEADIGGEAGGLGALTAAQLLATVLGIIARQAG